MTHCTVRGILLFAVFVLLPSCGDDQAPTDVMFDVAGANDVLAAARNVVMSPGLDAHLALAPRFTTPAGAPSSTIPQTIVTQQIAVLPAAYLGTTFALEEAGGAYAPTELTGAPADALRFMVYALDSSGDAIIGSTIGHADLTDDGIEMENGFSIGILVTADEMVIADYSTSFDAAGPTGLARASALDHVGLRIAGALRTPTGEIQIDMVTGTVNGIITTEFALVSGDATITGQMMIEQDSDLRLLQGELELGDDRIGVTANGGPNAFGAQITVNGTAWATVSVQPEAITVTGDAGALDSTEQSVALRMAEYFLMVPRLASGLVPGVLEE